MQASNRQPYADARHDAQGWFAAVRRGGFDHGFGAGLGVWAYYKPGLRYKTGGRFLYFDFMGRRTEHNRTFDCVLEPESGKVETLCVQALDSICALSNQSPNCTWYRTMMRDASPKTLWAAGLPYIFVDKKRRDNRSLYTVGGKVSVAFAWVFVAVPGVLLSVSRPQGAA